MVEQGDIINVNFNPQSGHEQMGRRPAVVISNKTFNEKTNLALVCPITNTDKNFPLHVKLGRGITTTGVILCEHVKSFDLNSRGYTFIEKLPTDTLEEVITIVLEEIEIL